MDFAPLVFNHDQVASNGCARVRHDAAARQRLAKRNRKAAIQESRSKEIGIAGFVPALVTTTPQ